MRKQLLFLSVGVLLMASSVFAQTQKAVSKKEAVAKSAIKKTVSSSEICPSLNKPIHHANVTKAQWDVLYNFNVNSSGQQAVETDGQYVYTAKWQTDAYIRKYDLNGTLLDSFTIAGVAAGIRDLAYDGTYFYGRAGATSTSIYKMDFVNKTLVATIPMGGKTVRHLSYDPTLDGGNGGFWTGDWNSLSCHKMDGSVIATITPPTAFASVYGTTFDGTSAGGPYLWAFSQAGTPSDVVLLKYNIANNTIDETHDLSTITGVNAAALAGGLGGSTTLVPGYFVVLANFQQTPNKIAVIEIAITASPTAPAAPANLTVVPDANGALTYDVSWTNPTLDVAGDSLTSITSISYYVDDVLVNGLTYNLSIGGINTFTGLTVSTPGYHTFKVVCTNASGDGLPASVTEWIGYIPPANITITNITDVTATLNWTQTGNPDSWDIEIVSHGVSPTGTPTFNTTTNPFLFNNLVADSTYDVYMRADYTGGNSVWVGPTTFTTDHCNPGNKCGFVLEFTDSYGDGWNGASITINQDGILVGNYSLATGDSGNQTVMLCPNANVTLVFNSGNHDDECGFTLKDPFGNILTTFAAGSAPAGDSTFFTFTSSCTPPSCQTPTNLSATNLTPTSAQLIWTAGGSETAWNIEYGPAGFTHGTGTVINVTSNPYTLTGLTQGTSYDVYIQADCGNGDLSYWTPQPVSFTLPCNAYDTFPFTESFEGSVFPPQCWTNLDADGDGHKWETRTSTNGWRVYDGDVAAVSASWTFSDGALTPNNYLITPNFTISNANMVLKLHIAPQDPAYPSEYFGVEVSTTGNAPANFTSIYTYTLTAADTIYKEVILPLAAYNGQNIYIAFRHYNSTNMFYMLLDKVEVYENNEIDLNGIQSNVFVYPNPATTTLKVANENAKTIEIFNLNGQKVAEFNNTNTANVANLAQGMYMVKVVTNNQVITQKINIVR